MTVRACVWLLGLCALMVVALMFPPSISGQEKTPTPEWEFKAVPFSSEEKDATRKLNELAKEGWQYVGPLGNGLVAFKRTAVVVVQKAEEIRRIEWEAIHVYNTTFSPDGRFCLAGGDAGALRLYEVASGKQILEVAHGVWAQHAVFTADGKQFLSAGTDGTLRLWDIAAGKEVRKFEGHSGGVYSVDLTRDNKWAASGSEDKSLRLWDVESGKEVRKFEGHTELLSGVLFTPDGKQLLSSSFDKTLRLWDVESGKEVRRFEGHTDGLFGVFVFPDGKRALSYSIVDKTARVWDLATGKEESKLDLGEELPDIRGVALSPDGKRILVGHNGTPGIVRLVDLATGKEFHRFEVAAHPRGLSFSRDGRFAASGSFRGLVYLWRLPGTFASGK